MSLVLIQPSEEELEAVQAVANAAIDTFQVSWRQIFSRQRPARVAWARQVAMATLMEQYGWSSNRVGQIFDRDHGAVLHARKVVWNRCEVDQQSRREVARFLARLAQLRKGVAA